MTDAPELTELTERMGRLLREAYKLGALKGQQESDAMRTKLLAALGVEHSSSAPEAPRKTKRRPSTSSVARAPKGLVVGALVQIFKTVDGITTKEAETRAVAVRVIDGFWWKPRMRRPQTQSPCGERLRPANKSRQNCRTGSVRARPWQRAR